MLIPFSRKWIVAAFGTAVWQGLRVELCGVADA
jgi:hypothetical protein